MANNIKDQIEAFLTGLHELVPKDFLSIFDPRELELLISGLPEIDGIHYYYLTLLVDDLKANTELNNYTMESPQIQWLWTILNSFDREQLVNFVQFSTGTSKVPLEGFKGLQGMEGIQKFQVHRVFDKDRLPTSHTW